jgi:hypothetical protein
MPQPLAITSSDQAAGCLRRAGVAEDVLAWFDPLHIGPVPAGEDLTALSDRRASFFERQSFGFRRLGHPYFASRDARLAEAAASTDIVLFFQDNLGDQLHQLQVLDFLASIELRQGLLLAVHVDGFIDELTEMQTLALVDAAVDVTPAALELAEAVWSAYRQPTPEAWAGLADCDTSELPFLGRAVRRALEELPDAGSGLSRSQRQILDVLRRRNLTARDLWHAYFDAEPHSHLDDWVLYSLLDGLAEGPHPLISGKPDVAFNPNMALVDWRRYMLPELALTPYGQSVLRGEADDREHNGTDHWWGGTHLTDGQLWRWERRIGSLVPPGSRSAVATGSTLSDAGKAAFAAASEPAA